MPPADPPLRVVALTRSPLPEALAVAFASASGDPPLLSLARALASHDGWPGHRPGVLSVRDGHHPALAAIGRFGPEEEDLLELLHDQLRRMLPRTRVLDHAAVEAACLLLAARLRERFDERDLARMRFAGIPRGGLIVLGTLAYALGIPRQRLTAWAGDACIPAADGALVVVDDCVISGLRLAEFLEHRHDESEVVVATLFSHPDLRTALRARDPRVRDVVSAFDLANHAPEVEGKGYEAWRARWLERSDARAAWIGQPDHVCFPWGEPESSMWNTRTDREEKGWPLMPPELCLSRRGRKGSMALSAQLQPVGRGDYHPAENVVSGDLGDEVVIGQLESGAAYAVEGVGAHMWREALGQPSLEAAAAVVAHAYGATSDVVLADMHAFVADLLRAGLLERRA